MVKFKSFSAYREFLRHIAFYNLKEKYHDELADISNLEDIPRSHENSLLTSELTTVLESLAPSIEKIEPKFISGLSDDLYGPQEETQSRKGYLSRKDALSIINRRVLKEKEKDKSFDYDLIKGVFDKLFFDKVISLRKMDFLIDENQDLRDLEKIAQIQNRLTSSSWSIYVFWEEKTESLDKQLVTYRYGLKQSLIEFKCDNENDGSGKIILNNLNYNELKQFSYDGKYRIVLEGENSYIWTTNLKEKNVGAQLTSESLALHILFHLGKVNLHEYAFGIYGKLRADGSIYSGTALLIENSEKDTIKDITSKNCIIYKNIQPHVTSSNNETQALKEKIILNLSSIPNEHTLALKLLRNRGQSYIKAPTKGFNSLKKTLSRHFANLKDKYTHFHRINQYEYFISIPLSSGDDKIEYTRNRLLALEIEKIFAEKFGLYNAYLACKNHLTLKAFKAATANIKTYEKTLEAISLCDIFVLIFPNQISIEYSDKHFSSCWPELGAAIALRKKVIIIIDNDFLYLLPRIVINYPHKTQIEYDSKATFEEILSTPENIEDITNVIYSEVD